MDEGADRGGPSGRATPSSGTVLSLAFLLLAGCFYVTKAEYDAVWDVDDDGWPLDEDCAPDDPEIHPFAPDRRGDGCDSDCGAEPDADGDDWPDDADCGADDPSIHPCAPDTDGDGVDSDCDGRDAPRTDTCEGIDPLHPDAEPIPADACPADLVTGGVP